MKKTRVWATLALLSLALPAAAAPPPPEPARDPANPFPRPQFQALPDKVVGVLVSGAQDVLALEGRRGPADVFCLGCGDGSYRWMYVPVPKKWIIGGLNIRVGPKGDTVKRFTGLSMANPKTVERWGVSGPYALVEVEVNAGLGAPPGEHFVATNLRVVDGTKEYPLHVAKVIDDLRRQFQIHLKLEEDAIARGLYAARERLPAGHKRTPGREQTETLFVTWLPETQQLRVILQARITEKALATAPPLPPPPAVDTGDGRPPDPPVHAGVQLGVELGVTYEVSKLGLLDGSRDLPLRPYHKELLAPAPSSQVRTP
jgi:hypothetical protein